MEFARREDQVKTPPLPCVFQLASRLKTPPLPFMLPTALRSQGTAFALCVAHCPSRLQTPPLPCVFRCLRGKENVFALCFHCRRRYRDTASFCCSAAVRL